MINLCSLKHKRRISIALLLIFIFSQILLIENIAFADISEIDCTITPSSIDVSSKPVRVTVTADSGEPFSEGQSTPYLLTSSGADSGASITNVSSTSSKVQFTVAKSSLSGTFTVRIVNMENSTIYNCGTIKLGVPSITSITPSSAANEYSESITVSLVGSNTNFKSGSTTVEIIDGNNTTAQTPTNISVSDTENLSFTLKTGLTSGTYSVKTTTPLNDTLTETVLGTDILTIRGDAQISLSTSTLNESYDTTQITVSGTSTGFNSSTTVQIIEDTDGDGVIDDNESATGKSGSPNILSATSLSFNVNAGLTFGNYIVKVSTGEETATAKLKVGFATAKLTDSNGTDLTGINQGYTTSQNLKLAGTNTSFSSSTTIALFDSTDTEVSNKLSNKSVDSSTSLSFTLATGLEDGDYTLKAVTGSQTVEATLSILENSISSVTYNSTAVNSEENIITEGYTAFKIDMTGQNTLFQDNTTVKIIDSSDVEVADKVSSLSRNGQILSFTLGASITKGSYKIKIDMDGSSSTTTDIVYQTFTVEKPTITSVVPTSVLQGNSAVLVSVICKNSKFISGTPEVNFTDVDVEPTNISVSELSSSENTERVDFYFVPSSTKFPNGDYNFTISLNNTYISSEVTSSITVSDSGITLSPSTIYSNELGTKSININGTGTSFSSANTKVYIDYVDENSTPVSSSVTSTSLIKFTIPEGLTEGSHEITVKGGTTSADTPTYTSNIYVINRNISITPTSAIEGYTSYAITLTSTGLNFDTGTNKPIINIKDSSNNLTPVSSDSIDIKSTSKLTFDFPTGKESGKYTIVLTWSDSSDYSDVEMTANCIIAPGAPAASKDTDTYNTDLSITLTLDDNANKTYYTLDGTTPTSTSTEYSSDTPISISGTTGDVKTLKAISYNSDSLAGAVMTKIYTFDKSGPNTPTVDIDSGTYNENQVITITPDTEASSTYYTTDGTIPTADDSKYTASFTITAVDNTTKYLKIRSFDSLGNASATVTKTYKFDLTGPSKPTADIESGTYTTEQKITLNLADDAKSTYYTTDDTTPSKTNGTAYTSGTITIPFNESAPVVLKAISYDSLENSSSILEETYIYNASALPAPTSSKANGTYNTNLTIMLTVDDNADKTYYTTNGEEPTTSDILYDKDEGITIVATDGSRIVLKATSYDSNTKRGLTMTKTYVFDTTGPTEAGVDVEEGSYTSPKSVNITPAIGASSTYYTTNGDTPSKDNGNLYSSEKSVYISSTTTLKIISYDNLGNAGDIASFTYTITDSSSDDDSSSNSNTSSSNTSSSSTSTSTSTTTTTTTTTTTDTTDNTDDNTSDDSDDTDNSDNDDTDDSDDTNNTDNPEPTDTIDTTPTPKPTPIEIEIDLTDNIKIDETENKSIIELSKEILEKVKDKIEESKDEDKLEFQFDIPENDTKLKEIKLDKELLGDLADKKADIKIKSDDSELRIPVEIMEEYKEKDLEVQIKTLSEDDKKEIESAIEESTKKGIKLTGTIIDFTINSVENDEKIPVTKLNQAVTIAIKLDENNLEELNVKKLGIYYLNETSGEWIYVGGKFNDKTGKFEADTDHFTKFAIMEYSKEFTDVEKSYWGFEYIDILVSKHIINGMTDTTFNPKGELTRAQFSKLIATALNLKSENYNGTFSDVADSMWYTPYIEAVYKAGIVNGIGNNKFDPNAKITREQMAVMIMNAYSYSKSESIDEIANDANISFTDFESSSDWAKTSIKAANALGIINGMDEYTFAPFKTSQRDQAAKVIYVLLELLEEL
jgi:hypothetical protein